MALELIVMGAGFPRARNALEVLLPGKKCHDMFEAFANKEQAQWAAATQHGWEVKNKNIIKILNKYQYTIDMPTMLWWKDIKKEFPNAKVILTVRDDFDAWHKSILETVYVHYKMSSELPWWSAPLFPQMFYQRHYVNSYFGPGGLFDGKFEDKEFARKVYEHFIEDVKRSVPSSQLLVFNVKQGWAPLCEFLGVPIPDTPFPHARENELEGFRQFLELRRKQRWQRINMVKAGAAAVLAGSVAAVLAVTRR